MKNSVSSLWPLLLVAVLGTPAFGQVWTQVTTPVVPTALATDPTNADHLLVGESGQEERYESLDGGATWTPISLPTVPQGVWRNSYSFDNGGNLVCSLGRGQSANPLAGPIAMIRLAGAWEPLGPDVAPLLGFSVTGQPLVRGRLDPDRLALTAYEAGIFSDSLRLVLSSDGGLSWSAEQSGSAFEIIEDTGEPYLLSSILFFYFGSETYFYRSVGFEAPNLPLNGGEDAQFGIAPAHPSNLWSIAATSDTEQIFQRSYDGGATWVTIGLKTGPDRLFGLRVHPTRLECAVAWQAGDMVITTDGGLTFTSLGVPYTPKCFVEDGNVLYATQFSSLQTELHRAELFPSVGVAECSAQVNGSGLPASIDALGSASIGENALSLVATDVTPHQFGYFLVSQTAGFVPNPGGSYGDLCLGGGLGRYIHLIQDSGPFGRLFGELDLNAIPTPSGTVMGQQGQTMRFQAWFRDVSGGVPGSNFSNAVAVTLTP